MGFNLFRNKEKELEKERAKLIYELESNGIKNLVKKMDSNEPYSELIREKQKKGNYSSDDDISMHAYKVSIALNNPSDKQELLHLLNDREYQPYRKHIFSCLTSICSNTGDYLLFDFLLKQIAIEDDEDIIVSVLSRLAKIKKPREKDISVIKKFLLEGSSNMQRAAIMALSNSEDEEVEDLLLNEFKISDRQTKGTICKPLQSVGTKKAVPILQNAYKQTRDPFLRHQIEYTLNEIYNREESQG